MKKLGFTLSELLITLGIVGVTAALVAPAVTNMMPDKNKMMFIKNYNELATLTEKMLNDKKLYYTEYKIAENDMDLDGDGNKDVFAGGKYPTCVGLECTDLPLKTEYVNEPFAKGNSKFAFLLSQYLGVNKEDFEKGFPNVFRTPDRTCWKIAETTDTNNYTRHQLFLIYNYEDEDSCKNAKLDIYPTNKNSNAHLLEISKSGTVTAYDSLSKAYLLNPNNMHDKKRDLKCAQILSQNGTPEDCAKIDD